MSSQITLAPKTYLKDKEGTEDRGRQRFKLDGAMSAAVIAACVIAFALFGFTDPDRLSFSALGFVSSVDIEADEHSLIVAFETGPISLPV